MGSPLGFPASFPSSLFCEVCPIAGKSCQAAKRITTTKGTVSMGNLLFMVWLCWFFQRFLLCQTEHRSSERTRLELCPLDSGEPTATQSGQIARRFYGGGGIVEISHRKVHSNVVQPNGECW